jgi:hypothetical protein
MCGRSITLSRVVEERRSIVSSHSSAPGETGQLRQLASTHWRRAALDRLGERDEHVEHSPSGSKVFPFAPSSEYSPPAQSHHFLGSAEFILAALGDRVHHAPRFCQEEFYHRRSIYLNNSRFLPSLWVFDLAEGAALWIQYIESADQFPALNSLRSHLDFIDDLSVLTMRTHRESALENLR